MFSNLKKTWNRNYYQILSHFSRLKTKKQPLAQTFFKFLNLLSVLRGNLCSWEIPLDPQPPRVGVGPALFLPNSFNVASADPWLQDFWSARLQLVVWEIVLEFSGSSFGPWRRQCDSRLLPSWMPRCTSFEIWISCCSWRKHFVARML